MKNKFTKTMLITLNFLFMSTGFGQTLAKNKILFANIQASYSGTGCPQGTVASHVSGDFEAATWLANSFQVEKAANSDSSYASKYCKTIFKIYLPNNYRARVGRVSAEGYMDLERGITGFLNTNYYLDGVQLNRSTFTKKIVGPYAENFQVEHELQAKNGRSVSSRCGGMTTFTIQQTINLTSTISNAKALATLDVVEIEFDDLGVSLERCN